MWQAFFAHGVADRPVYQRFSFSEFVYKHRHQSCTLRRFVAIIFILLKTYGPRYTLPLNDPSAAPGVEGVQYIHRQHSHLVTPGLLQLRQPRSVKVRAAYVLSRCGYRAERAWYNHRHHSCCLQRLCALLLFLLSYRWLFACVLHVPVTDAPQT